MRRSIRTLIVALLCLTLFVDSAKACWWRRQHRTRAQVCRPTACPPATTLRCTDVPVDGPAHGVDTVEEPADCLCGPVTEEHAAQVIEHVGSEHGVAEQVAVNATAPVGESVVVHGPTMVVDAAPALPAADKQTPPVAQPMPIAAADPAALPTPTAAQEPIPNLKPATAQSPVAPASNEQPMPEPQSKPAPMATEAAAAAAKPTAEDDAAEETDDEEMELSEPKPAAADDLAGGPAMKPPMPPQQPNLFDLYDDEGDDAVAAGDASTDDAGEPAEEAEATEGDDAEMAEDDATPAADAADEEKPDAEASEADKTDDDAEAMQEGEEEEATDGDDQSAAPEASADEAEAEDTAEEADAAPEAEPEQAEADPAAAAVAVPDEPMRRWTDETGTHHAQGWLVEMRADRVRILKVNGRHATVSMESLSSADRDYVSAVGARLAAEGKGTVPAPSTTAGL